MKLHLDIAVLNRKKNAGSTLQCAQFSYSKCFVQKIPEKSHSVSSHHVIVYKQKSLSFVLMCYKPVLYSASSLMSLEMHLRTMRVRAGNQLQIKYVQGNSAVFTFEVLKRRLTLSSRAEPSVRKSGSARESLVQNLYSTCWSISS